MQINRGVYGLRNMIRILGQHCSHNACQDVSAASFRHPGIACGIHGNFSAGMRDQSPPALQDEGDGMTSGEVTGNLLPVRLHLGDTLADEASHLAWMRCENEGAIPTVEEIQAPTGENIQG